MIAAWSRATDTISGVIFLKLCKARNEQWNTQLLETGSVYSSWLHLPDQKPRKTFDAGCNRCTNDCKGKIHHLRGRDIPCPFHPFFFYPSPLKRASFAGEGQKRSWWVVIQRDSG